MFKARTEEMSDKCQAKGRARAHVDLKAELKEGTVVSQGHNILPER